MIISIPDPAAFFRIDSGAPPFEACTASINQATVKLVAERRIELLISRLSIECFKPTKLLRNGAEKRIRTADLLHTGRALFHLGYFGLDFGADGRTRTCDELGVGQPI